MSEEIKKGIQFNFESLKLVEESDENNVHEVQETLEQKQQREIEYEKRTKQEWAEKSESGIPIRFQNASLENYVTSNDEERNNLSAIKKFCEGKGRQMMLFIGRYGNGKTHLGCAVVREFTNKARFTTSFEICTRYEMGGDFKAKENRWEVLERFINYDVLVIDEFGRAKPEVERLIIPYIINARYENKKKTVLITNLEKNDVVQILGEAIVDRLKEICSTIVFNGESKRGGKLCQMQK